MAVTRSRASPLLLQASPAALIMSRGFITERRLCLAPVLQRAARENVLRHIHILASTVIATRRAARIVFSLLWEADSGLGTGRLWWVRRLCRVALTRNRGLPTNKYCARFICLQQSACFVRDQSVLLSRPRKLDIIALIKFPPAGIRARALIGRSGQGRYAAARRRCASSLALLWQNYFQ